MLVSSLSLLFIVIQIPLFPGTFRAAGGTRRFHSTILSANIVHPLIQNGCDGTTQNQRPHCLSFPFCERPVILRRCPGRYPRNRLCIPRRKRPCNRRSSLRGSRRCNYVYTRRCSPCSRPRSRRSSLLHALRPWQTWLQRGGHPARHTMAPRVFVALAGPLPSPAN